MKRTYEAVLFDADGVLVHSYSLIQECHALTLKTFCGQCPDVTDVPWGTTFVDQLSYLIRKCACEERINLNAAVEFWRGLYCERHNRMVTVSRDIRSLLRQLEHQHIKFGVITNRDRARFSLLNSLIPELDRASCTITLDDVRQRKPAAEPILRALRVMAVSSQRVLYIGDTKNDLLSAKAAGVDCLLVLGKIEKEELHNCTFPAVRTVDNSDDVAFEVKKLLAL